MAFLGVDQSLSGREWVGPSIKADRAAEAMMQDTGLARPLCQVLARREVAPSDAAAFLKPTLKDLLPDPRGLKDMQVAGARVLQAVRAKEKIAIFADYDVDGATSAALLIDWLRQMGHAATLYVPDRIKEGYGPNVPAMQRLAKDHDLIICVDCGTVSHEPIAAAGKDVIVLDHHLGGETLPEAVAVVNPNRQDESGDLGYLCAAGVVFLLLVELGRQMREAGIDQRPDLKAMLDLVALGTVADVAPLIAANRALVRQGLTVMGNRARTGLVALADVARMDTAPSSYHLGFVLGPRINAGGRIGTPDLGARLLSSTSEGEAASIAERLDQLNSERRDVEAGVRAAAMEQAEARGMDAPLVWAAGAGWHPGVVGIVASRLKDAANRPALVIGVQDGIGKGSGRSVSGVDLGAAIQRLVAEGLLLAGGGHKMAAGLTVAEDKLEPAMTRLSDLLEKQGAGRAGPRDLHLDGVLMPGAVTVDLIEQIETAGPFGAGAPAPRFALPDIVIHHARRIGDAHLKLSISDGTGPKIDAIAFGAFDGPMGAELSNSGGARFHLAGRLEINTWKGRQQVQLRFEDAAYA